MDFENERSVLSAYFTSFWQGTVIQAIANPVPAIQWNNQPFTQPENQPWVRFNLIPITSKAAAIGGILVRTDAIMAVQIFIPGTAGTSLAKKLADAMAEQFNFLALAVARGYIHFTALSPEDYGHNDGFYQLNANIPYWRDTIRVGPFPGVDGGQTFVNTPGNNLDGGSF